MKNFICFALLFMLFQCSEDEIDSNGACVDVYTEETGEYTPDTNQVTCYEGYLGEWCTTSTAVGDRTWYPDKTCAELGYSAK